MILLLSNNAFINSVKISLFKRGDIITNIINITFNFILNRILRALI